MNLIILTEADRTQGDEFHLADKRALHIADVLKTDAGETVEVGLVNGPIGTARVLNVSATEARLAVSLWREAPRRQYEVDIICGIPRPKTVKKLLAVSAMMGVRALHFVRANRTDKSYVTSELLLPPANLPYLYDGLSQGRQTGLPIVEVHPLFRPFVEDRVPVLYNEALGVMRLLADTGESRDLGQILSDKAPDKFVIAIGPEGGWVPFESELLKQHGFAPFVLGPWTLRVEFALPAALAQLELQHRQLIRP